MWLEKLKELKAKRGMTSQELAEKSNVPLSTVKRILTGQTDNPGIQTVNDLFTALDSSLGDFMHDSTENKQPEQKEDPKDVIIRMQREEIKHKNRWIVAIFIIALFFACAFVFLVLYDATHPDVGFIRY